MKVRRECLHIIYVHFRSCIIWNQW